MLNGTNKFSDEISFADDDATNPNDAESARRDLGLPARDGTTRPATRSTVRPTTRQAMPVINQDAERVDAEGAKRAQADEEQARKLGFSPKPPVYEIGTVVNSTGVANFKRSRSEWAAMPALPELASTFSDRIKAEQRTDHVVEAPSLHACADGRLGLYDASGKPSCAWLTSERALTGLATHITPGGASYLAQCPPELRADNLNHWLKNAKQVDARASKRSGKRGGSEVLKDKKLTLRTRARKGGSREVFSVVGPKYAAFDVDKVAREAAAGIGGDARGVITYDGYRMTLDAIFHSNIAPENAVAGEFFKGTVRITAADDGSGAVRVSLGLWRNLCRNLIIVDFDKVLVGSRKHIGSATIEEDVRELMSSASERIALMVGKWSEASTEDVIERYGCGDVESCFRGLILNGAVAATGIKTDDMVSRLMTAWRKEPGHSKTAILNAITRSAHEQEWRSWADTEELESQAGELLYAKAWNVDYAERSAEELLA